MTLAKRLFLKLSIATCLWLTACGGSSSSLTVEPPAPVLPPARDPSIDEQLRAMPANTSVFTIDMSKRAQVEALLGQLSTLLSDVYPAHASKLGGKLVCTRDECFGTLDSAQPLDRSQAREVAGFTVINNTLALVGPTLALQVRENGSIDQAITRLAASIAGTTSTPVPAEILAKVDFATADIAQVLRGESVRRPLSAAGSSFEVFANLSWIGACVRFDEPVRGHIYGLAPNESTAILVESSARQVIATFRDNFLVRMFGVGMILDRATITRDGLMLTGTSHVTRDELRALASRFSESGMQLPANLE